jgi:hypothetical protein
VAAPKRLQLFYFLLKNDFFRKIFDRASLKESEPEPKEEVCQTGSYSDGT